MGSSLPTTVLRLTASEGYQGKDGLRMEPGEQQAVVFCPPISVMPEVGSQGLRDPGVPSEMGAWTQGCHPFPSLDEDVFVNEEGLSRS